MVAIIGLAALILAYVTGSIVLLALAVVAFIVGLYLMGANRKPVQKEEGERNTKNNS
ncbi:MAG: hypothetical protein JRN67_01115 [Nitrososphaerota archaeon]|jgi:uncharacterized membrane protein|nr:hypothetical protein [Nitrososphaerota archaeon]